VHPVAVIQNCLFAVEQRPIHRACNRSTALVSSYVVVDEMLFQVVYAMKFPVLLVKGSLSVAAAKVALYKLTLKRQQLWHSLLHKRQRLCFLQHTR
jgi:hypothetical protein